MVTSSTIKFIHDNTISAPGIKIGNKYDYTLSYYMLISEKRSNGEKVIYKINFIKKLKNETIFGYFIPVFQFDTPGYLLIAVSMLTYQNYLGQFRHFVCRNV